MKISSPRAFVFLTLLFCTFTAGRALADDSGSACYPAGLLIADLYGAQGFNYTGGNASKTREDMTEIFGGVSWYFVPDISFGWTLTGAYTTQPGQTVNSGGGNLQFRIHFLDEKRWTIFWDDEMGLLESNHDIPPGGTDLNFMVHTGLGATLRVTNNLDVIAGARYLHLSNADVHGNHRNPSINGGEEYMGLIFRL